MSFASASEDRRPCQYKCARPNLAGSLGQIGLCCGEHRFVVIIGQPTEKATDSAGGLAQKQISGGLIRWRRVSISTRELDLGILTAEDAGRGKKIHCRFGNPFLNKLHIEDRLAISYQRAIDGEIKTPDQAAELARVRLKLLALNRHIRDPNSRSKAIDPSSPRSAYLSAGWFHHGVVNFLELHAWPAHADERDKRSQHFIAAFANLVDPRIAQHSFQRKIDKVSRAAINLKCVVDYFPKPLGRKNFQHGCLDHVV